MLGKIELIKGTKRAPLVSTNYIPLLLAEMTIDRVLAVGKHQRSQMVRSIHPHINLHCIMSLLIHPDRKRLRRTVHELHSIISIFIVLNSVVVECARKRSNGVGVGDVWAQREIIIWRESSGGSRSKSGSSIIWWKVMVRVNVVGVSHK